MTSLGPCRAVAPQPGRGSWLRQAGAGAAEGALRNGELCGLEDRALPSLVPGLCPRRVGGTGPRSRAGDM